MNLLICVDDTGYEGELRPRKLYERIEDESADELGVVRVTDESGEDYLYSASMFLPIHIPRDIERQRVKKAA
jgi:hypothetical protein